MIDSGLFDPCHARRLWSLSDIMKVFSVTNFLMLHDIARTFANIADSPEPGWFVRLFWKPSLNRGRPIDAAEKENTDRAYAEWEQSAIDLGLTASVATLRKIRKSVTRSGSKLGDEWKFGAELSERLRDEMNGRFFLSLSLSETEYYSNYRQKWADVIERFPASEDDIDEAGKCFALGRYAASVFHSLQVIEVGLIELGRILVVNDPHPGWGASTNRLKAILKTKFPDRTSFQKEHSAMIEQLDAMTESLKSAWRNKVSHAYGKLTLLTAGFAPDVAEEILVTSRGFMRRLAMEMPSCPDLDA